MNTIEETKENRTMENFGINANYVKKLANATAKKNGFNRCTKITFSNVSKPKIGETIDFGYRKITTNEYVPNSYMNKFGWKNCYYQNVICEVILPMKYKLISKRK